ncbi:ABC transporter ATP-binding protein [uncultured Robinsoniella sp.]|uniref:ABC transporter ATP-binding protein n=1 Tax=uncultured Robinsoniella sp. TaxID=904190 RepID=UPI00374F72CB
MVLKADNISFRYDKNGREIFRDFNLEVHEEEVVGLVAPSGFGKTTLCKILAGYMKPDTGAVYLDDKPLYKMRGCCPVQMIWQHPEQAVNPRLRMGEVIKEGDQVDPAVIRGLGIEEDWMNRFPTELSGGELQRFCIARALGKSTRFLLADEISTMLDLITQSQIWNFLLEETSRRKIGLIAVSHSEALLDAVCTRQVMLENAVN